MLQEMRFGSPYVPAGHVTHASASFVRDMLVESGGAKEPSGHMAGTTVPEGQNVPNGQRRSNDEPGVQ